MNEDEERRLGELEDARADDERSDDGNEDDDRFDPMTGGPGLTGLTPPD